MYGISTIVRGCISENDATYLRKPESVCVLTSCSSEALSAQHCYLWQAFYYAELNELKTFSVLCSGQKCFGFKTTSSPFLLHTLIHGIFGNGGRKQCQAKLTSNTETKQSAEALVLK